MADAPEQAPKKKKSKLLLIIVLLLVLGLLGGGGYFAYIKFFKAQPAATEEAAPAEGEQKKEEKKEEKKEDKKEEKKKDEKKTEKKDGKKDEAKPVTGFQNIITNLADPGGRRYVRISLDFDFKDEDTARDFTDNYQAKVKDAVLTLLLSKTAADLSSLEGMITFRKEVVARINQIMGQGRIKDVYVTDRLIQ
ncbi:hypothetical protein JCM15519_23590 [Fundidesulfovibrio butyratiphilus]